MDEASVWVAGPGDRSVPGVARCLRCGYQFVSPDAVRARRCLDCKDDRDGEYEPPRGQEHPVTGD
jgi:predicted Zn-ribbon and HTH transcriptional regulator